MSKVKSPPEKKRLAYGRDHYLHSGQHDKAWRKVKPLIKAKAARAARHADAVLLARCGGDADAAHEAECSPTAPRAKRVRSWGAVGLRQFVADRLATREERIGAKQRRRDARA